MSKTTLGSGTNAAAAQKAATPLCWAGDRYVWGLTEYSAGATITADGVTFTVSTPLAPYRVKLIGPDGISYRASLSGGGNEYAVELSYFDRLTAHGVANKFCGDYWPYPSNNVIATRAYTAVANPTSDADAPYYLGDNWTWSNLFVTETSTGKKVVMGTANIALRNGV